MDKIIVRDADDIEMNMGYRLSRLIGDIETHGDKNGLTPVEVSRLARKLRDYHDDILNKQYRVPYEPDRIDKSYKSIDDKTAPKDEF